MGRYKLQSNGGVTYPEKNLSIPNNPDNIDWQKYQEWLAKGNKPDPVETTDEKKLRLFSEFIVERNKRIVEADKWELPFIQKRYNITQEQVEKYKQYLLDMNNTLTLNSTISDLENPKWQDKLIIKVLL
jgi:hypothetical protein